MLPQAEVLIIGSGAGGGIAAWVLAEAGYRVLVLEKGPWLDESTFSNDDVKFGYRDFYTQDILVEPRTFRQTANQTARVNHVSPLSRCVGGGSLHYGAASFRFLPDHFRMASMYGVPPGSTLTDWPLTYDELEPHYTAVEQGIVIAGLAPGHPAPSGYPGARYQPPANDYAMNTFGLRYSKQYPVPPVAQRYDAIAFKNAASSLGLHAYPSPCAINTVEGYDGRHACVNCGFCNGWGCPNGAKSSTLVTALRRAVATGRCEIRPECYVRRVVMGADGRARSVLYLDRDFKMQEQPAELIVLAASTIDTPRLALLSELDRHDESGMIGRNLTTHHAPSAVVNITDGVHTWDTYRGAWNTISLDDYQDLSSHTALPGGVAFPRAGVISMVGNSPGYPVGSGGPISLAISFMKPPGFYSGGGNAFLPIGGWGPTLLQGMASYYNTQAFLLSVCEDMPMAGNRVDLDPTVKDVYGDYVGRVTYFNHPNDIALGPYISSLLTPIGEEMLRSIGATGAVVPTPTPITSYAVGPRYNVHQHGTMRMGSKPDSSVVNRFGQFWGIPNLFVADGSLFPTAGGYNPTHTIEALAHWVATHIAESGAGLLQRGTNATGLPATTPAPDLEAAAALTAAATAAVSGKGRPRPRRSAPARTSSSSACSSSTDRQSEGRPPG